MQQFNRRHRGIHAHQLRDGSTVWDVVMYHAGTCRKVGGFLTKHEAIRARHYMLATHPLDRLSFLTIPSDGDRSPSTSSTPSTKEKRP